MKTFNCARCGIPVLDPHQRYERRIEFRKVRDQSRYRVLLDIHICKACVDAEIEEVRPVSNQGALNL